MNYYERHIGDYLKDTAHLSLLEHGIYTRLLDVYYTREGAIPDNQVERLVGARTKEEKQALATVLGEYFVLSEAGWVQARCEREIERFKDKQRKARASADARWANRQAHTESNANASPNAMRTHSEGNAPRARPQSPVTSPNNQEDPPASRVPPAGRGSRLPEAWDPGESGSAFAQQHGIVNGALAKEVERFRDYWRAKPGADGRKADWQATWRNWVRRAAEAKPAGRTDDVFAGAAT